jgi:hypothetical protein
VTANQQPPKRVARVTVYQPQGGSFFGPQLNAIVITGLRVQFKIVKTIGAEPNSCELKITNLAKQTRSFCESKPLSAIVEAGYNTPSLVFQGDARYGISKIDGPEWITTIQLGDGDRAYRFARVGRSFKPGTDVLTVLSEAARTMGLQLPSNVQVSTALQAQFATGKTLQGATRDELTSLLSPYDYAWSIQDGKLQILQPNETRPDEAVVISQDTGMVGSPEYGTPDTSGKPPTLHVKHRMHNFPPGSMVSIQSRDINGATFRVDKLTLTGDTMGGDFYAELECHPLGSPIKKHKGRHG